MPFSGSEASEQNSRSNRFMGLKFTGRSRFQSCWMLCGPASG
jgi:hypothetical protein